MFRTLCRELDAAQTDASTRQWRAAIVFAIGLCVATAALVWFAYDATRQWQHGTELLQERREAEALALAQAALVRDMRGAWAGLIVPIDHPALDEEPPYDLLHRTAETFAKFPYAESIVVWKGDEPSPRSYVFSRSDRQPGWDHEVHSDDPFPVLMRRGDLVERLYAAGGGEGEGSLARTGSSVSAIFPAGEDRRPA